jgi:hypothetical protein
VCAYAIERTVIDKGYRLRLSHLFIPDSLEELASGIRDEARIRGSRTVEILVQKHPQRPKGERPKGERPKGEKIERQKPKMPKGQRQRTLKGRKPWHVAVSRSQFHASLARFVDKKRCRSRLAALRGDAGYDADGFNGSPTIDDMLEECDNSPRRQRARRVDVGVGFGAPRRPCGTRHVDDPHQLGGLGTRLGVAPRRLRAARQRRRPRVERDDGHACEIPVPALR